MTTSSEHYPEERAVTAASAIVDSRVSGRQLGPLPDHLRPPDLQDAYHVQQLAHGLLISAGYGRIGGWKIGCTTAVMQEYLGVESPVAGAMFRSAMWQGQHRFEVSPPRVLGVECEIAVRVSKNMDRHDQPYSIAEAADAVSVSMAAIEVVENRYVDYLTMDIPTQVADDFYHFASVVGVEHESFDPHSLKDVHASMSINGHSVGSGKGSDILGDPLIALAWLASTLAQRGSPLQSGDVVSLGSLVKTQWVDVGDAVVVHNDLLGEVRATFEARGANSR